MAPSLNGREVGGTEVTVITIYPVIITNAMPPLPMCTLEDPSADDDFDYDSEMADLSARLLALRETRGYDVEIDTPRQGSVTVPAWKTPSELGMIERDWAPGSKKRRMNLEGVSCAIKGAPSMKGWTPWTQLLNSELAPIFGRFNLPKIIPKEVKSQPPVPKQRTSLARIRELPTPTPRMRNTWISLHPALTPPPRVGVRIRGIGGDLLSVENVQEVDQDQVKMTQVKT